MAMSVNGKIRAVNERFKQSHIGVDFDWLSGCVEFFCDETPTATIEQLFEQAHEQWLLSDLKDSGSSSCPNSIFTEKQSHTISGKFPMQLQYLIDISESAYDQLQRLYDKQLDEGKEQQEFKQTQAATRKRSAARGMLKLELFDGQRKVTAMEYRPIPCLTTKLTPGTKVLLSGPIRCVNHVLLLESKNIQLIGGEVESLAIENAFENVLLRKLNRPLNPKPKTDYAEEPAIVEYGVVERPILPRIPMTQPMLRTQTTAVVGDSLNDDFYDELLLDDELLHALDNEQFSILTNQPQQQPQQVNQQHSLENRNAFDSFGDLDDSALLQIDEQIVELTRAGAVESSQASATMPVVVPSTVVRSNAATVNRLTADSVGAPHQNIAICNDDYQFKIRGINLAFIDQLNKCSMVDKMRRRLFMIKVVVDDITQYAQIKYKQWSLVAVLTDHVKDGKLEARFSNDVLEKLTGHTGIEVHRMHKTKKDRPHIVEDINKILAELTEKLSRIHSYMKIEYTSDSDNPIVLEIIEPAPVLEQKMREKYKKEIE